MLLSKRERPPDNITATSNTSSSISYRRTSIPSISPLLVVSSTSPSNTAAPRRAPLAPLDPQVASSMSLDNQSSTPSSSSSTSYPAYSPHDIGKDADRAIETARALIGRPIITRSQEEEPSTSPQSLRKKSLPGQCVSLIYAPCRCISCFISFVVAMQLAHPLILRVQHSVDLVIHLCPLIQDALLSPTLSTHLLRPLT